MSVLLATAVVSLKVNGRTEVLLDLWSGGIGGRFCRWGAEDAELELAITTVLECRSLQILLFWEEELQVACLAL